MSFYIQARGEFVWSFQLAGPQITLFKIPGDLRGQQFVPGRNGREHLSVSMNVFNGWTLVGGIFAEIAGHQCALALHLAGQPKQGKLFAQDRGIHLLLCSSVPEDVRQCALTPGQPCQRFQGGRWTDAEWAEWHAQRRR